MSVKRDTKQTMLICLFSKSDFATCSAMKDIPSSHSHSTGAINNKSEGTLKVQHCLKANHGISLLLHLMLLGKLKLLSEQRSRL